jgi:excisionase family DNA binding protein
MSEYVSAVEAARLSGLSERTIRRWVKRGKLRAVRDGHAVRVPLSEVMDLCGRRSCQPADSGQVGHVDSGHSGASHDGGQATSHDNGQDSLLTLVRELKTELVQTAAAAAMWQARAEMLGHRLRALEAPREAPVGGPQSRQDARETASASGVASGTTPTPVPAGSWRGRWRQWWAGVAGT